MDNFGKECRHGNCVIGQHILVGGVGDVSTLTLRWGRCVAVGVLDPSATS